MIRKLLLITFCICILSLSFWGGVRYEQVQRHRQELVIVANLIGDDIVHVNEALDLSAAKPLSEVQENYNFNTLNDIGCLQWLRYLNDIDQSKILRFYKGVEIAMEKVRPERLSGQECIVQLQTEIKGVRLE